MGAVVERSTQDATRALVECDRALAQKVRDGDDEIDRHVPGHREAVAHASCPAGARRR